MNLTFEWLTPILLTIIGTLIVVFLKLITDSIKGIRDDFKEHVKTVDELLRKNDEEHSEFKVKFAKMET